MTYVDVDLFEMDHVVCEIHHLVSVGETPVVAMRRFLLLLALAREFYRYGVG
jgi:hypothetical protein